MIFSFFTKLSFELAEQSSSENLQIIEQAARAWDGEVWDEVFLFKWQKYFVCPRVKCAPLTPDNLTLTIVTCPFINKNLIFKVWDIISKVIRLDDSKS